MYVVPEMLDMQRGSEVRPSICAGHLDGHTTRLPAMRTGIKQKLCKPRPKYAWLWGAHPFTHRGPGRNHSVLLERVVAGREMMQWSQLSLHREDTPPPPSPPPHHPRWMRTFQLYHVQTSVLYMWNLPCCPGSLPEAGIWSPVITNIHSI